MGDGRWEVGGGSHDSESRATMGPKALAYFRYGVYHATLVAWSLTCSTQAQVRKKVRWDKSER